VPRRAIRTRIVMIDLNNRIARLELCGEQLLIHLRSLGRESPEAERLRSNLLAMLQSLVALKNQRERLETELRLDDAA
jgi:hypothetical protein